MPPIGYCITVGMSTWLRAKTGLQPINIHIACAQDSPGLSRQLQVLTNPYRYIVIAETQVPRLYIYSNAARSISSK